MLWRNSAAAFPCQIAMGSSRRMLPACFDVQVWPKHRLASPLTSMCMRLKGVEQYMEAISGRIAVGRRA